MVPVMEKALGVIQVGPSASGAGLRRLSGSHALLPLRVAGPAVVGAADLLNDDIVDQLKLNYEGGHTVALSNATEDAANALAQLLGDPRPVDLPDNLDHADLVSFRKITQGRQATFSVTVLLPVVEAESTPAQRRAGPKVLRQLDREHFAELFSPTPTIAPPGDDPDNLASLATKYIHTQQYNDNAGHQAQVEDTVYSVRSFTNQMDLYFISQEIQVTGTQDVGQVGTGGHGRNPTPPQPTLHAPPTVTQPSPAANSQAVSYTTGVNESFGGSIGWDEDSGFNAQISGGMTFENLANITVPPVGITYFPNLSAGTTNWLFISNQGNLSQITVTDSWVWQVPFNAYSTGQTNLFFTGYVVVGPVVGPTLYQVEDHAAAPLPFGDTFQLEQPIVSAVNVPSVAAGGKFTITGTGLYPFLVEDVLIGGTPLATAAFTVVSDTEIEVVAPNTPGAAQKVVVKTSQGLSNDTVTINIGSASQVSVQAHPVTAVAGQSLSNVMVAGVTDSDVNANPANFTAMINWGDGTASNGTVTAVGAGTGNFNVTGTHTYALAGNYTFSVQVTDPSGTKGSATGTATVSAQTGGPANMAARPVAAVANLSFTNATLATFTDSDPNATASDFTASVNWGDGVSTPSTTVTSGGPGIFNVLGTHTYNAAGTYTFAVEVTDNQSRKANASGTATVSSA